MGLLTVMVSVVVPATSQELLFRGVILPYYSMERPVLCAFSAGASRDVSGDPQGLLVLFAMHSYRLGYVASDSLYLRRLRPWG